MPRPSATVCYKQCCFQEDKCFHSPDPVFRPRCGMAREGGLECPEHSWAKVPVPVTITKPDFEWVGTSHRVPTKLDFKSTYENDVRVMCAIRMSNAFVIMGMDPLDVSDWARARFSELTAVGWKPAKQDAKNTLVELGFFPSDGVPG